MQVLCVVLNQLFCDCELWPERKPQSRRTRLNLIGHNYSDLKASDASVWCRTGGCDASSCLVSLFKIPTAYRFPRCKTEYLSSVGFYKVEKTIWVIWVYVRWKKEADTCVSTLRERIRVNLENLALVATLSYRFCYRGGFDCRCYSHFRYFIYPWIIFFS